MSTFLASAASASSTLMEDEDRHSSGSSYAPKGKLFGPLDKNVSKFSSDRNDGSAQMSAWLVNVDKAMRLNPQIYAVWCSNGEDPTTSVKGDVLNMIKVITDNTTSRGGSINPAPGALGLLALPRLPWA